MMRGSDLQDGARINLAIALRSGSLPARLVYIDASNESAGGGQAKGSDL
jgi:hypothetical protein